MPIFPEGNLSGETIPDKVQADHKGYDLCISRKAFVQTPIQPTFED